MAEYRKQKNLTISPEQAEFIKANHGKMNVDKLSIMLGLTYQKTYNNIKLLGLSNPQPREAKVIDFNNNGFFDVKKFGECYKY